ncbi:MAG TPA: permease-like cell division protein FtsX [Kofleriaceae bacterium]|nr:permease-like cell division protein FtsX [Kofleriaceae bacterium]
MLTAAASTITRTARVLAARPAASLWAVLAVAAALVGVAATDLASRHVGGWARDLRSQASMVVYLDDGATVDDAAALATRLRAVGGVEQVDVVSAEQAADRLRSALGSHDELLDGVEPGSLPVSIEVTLAPGLADVAGTSPLLASLRAAAKVEDVEVTRDDTAPLGAALERLRRLAWALLLVAGGAAALVVAAAVRLRLVGDREEHAALHWLGAGGWFRHGPRLVAGILLGAAGAAAAIGGATLLVHFLQLDAGPVLDEAQAIVTWPTARVVAMLGAGAGLGLVGGLLATGRDARA